MTREDGRQAQENPHVARTRSPTGEELDDVEKVIEQAGCSKTYYELEVMSSSRLVLGWVDVVWLEGGSPRPVLFPPTLRDLI
mmetsp:Transcript_2347/g.6502  ORF Transcript_2347/g.6502 Transcript_2347/m.6502 type:complete len:82 (-) Transcript_2347:532-777(-)